MKLIGEKRHCSNCMTKTQHTIIKQKDIMMRKCKSLYNCNKCNTTSWKRHLRPLAEGSY